MEAFSLVVLGVFIVAFVARSRTRRSSYLAQMFTARPVLFLLEVTAVATAVVDGEAASVAERFDCRLL